MSKELTDEDINKVIDLYLNSSLSLVSIANSIGYKTKDIVYRILKDKNIPKRRSVKRKISKEEELNVIDLYESGKSMSAIGKLYNVSSGTIKLILRDNLIKIRENWRTHSLDEKYFDNIDTNNKAYILGFIFADGFIRKDNLVMSVVVHKKDVDILHKIKNEINSDAPIEKVKNKEHFRINICSRYMCDSLNKLGCENGKTFSLRFPNIKDELIPHFIRGFMDGDGCISIEKRKHKKYFSLSFTGTEDMMNYIKYLLKVDNKVSFYNNAYALHIGKREDVVRILKWIYKDSDLYLDRKREKYLEIIKYIEEESVI